jgi:hypothetical protein
MGAVLLLGLGCNDNSTTGPKTAGLTILSQELIPSDSGCKLKLTLTNHTGSDLSGQITYSILNAKNTIIGTAIVFPDVPDGAQRTATSDFLVTTIGGLRLTCADVVTLQLLPIGTTVPIAPR